jgi:histidine triad (HIT) family protein
MGFAGSSAIDPRLDSDPTCAFCAIVHGTSEAEVIAETEASVAFMDAEPAAFGHVLVVPKRHAADIWSLDRADGRAVWELTFDVSQAVRSALQPEGLNLFQANGAAGWQTVFHFHLHVIPRWQGDPLVPNWESPAGDVEQVAPAARRIRHALAAGAGRAPRGSEAGHGAR